MLGLGEVVGSILLSGGCWEIRFKFGTKDTAVERRVQPIASCVPYSHHFGLVRLFVNLTLTI